jgi:hypothetical protein
VLLSTDLIRRRSPVIAGVETGVFIPVPAHHLWEVRRMPRVRRPKVTRDEWGSITQITDGRWRVRYPGPDGRRHDGVSLLRENWFWPTFRDRVDRWVSLAC